MKFSHDMSDYCSYCFRKLYANIKCNCEKSKLEETMNDEIQKETEKIKEKYKTEYGLVVDEKKVQDFKDKNEKYYPSRF